MLDYVPSWLNSTWTLLKKLNACIEQIELLKGSQGDIAEIKAEILSIEQQLGSIALQLDDTTSLAQTNEHDIGTLDGEVAQIWNKIENIVKGVKANNTIDLVDNNGNANLFFYSNNGLTISSDGTVKIYPASENDIKDRLDGDPRRLYQPLVPRYINDYVKASLTDDNKMVLTGQEKLKACQTLGAFHQIYLHTLRIYGVDDNGRQLDVEFTFPSTSSYNIGLAVKYITYALLPAWDNYNDQQKLIQFIDGSGFPEEPDGWFVIKFSGAIESQYRFSNGNAPRLTEIIVEAPV